ncbi:MAG: Hpt domain-containing protein [Deltaproteobacteria bacterium]|nr:Hpt domain-containing protein [Deltaproteobacteria bacterium]
MRKRDRKHTKTERFREFLAEAEDILNAMGNGLIPLGRCLKAGVVDHAVLNAVFRSAHTLKGMCVLFDFKEMASLSHAMEDTLDMLRKGKASFTGEVFDAIMCAHELMVKIVAAKEDGSFVQEIEGLKLRLRACCSPMESAETDAIDKGLKSVLTEYETHRLAENLRAGKSVWSINVGFPVPGFEKGYLSLAGVLKTEAEVIATLPSERSRPEMICFDVLAGTLRDGDFLSNLLKDFSPVAVRLVAGPSALRPLSGIEAAGPPKSPATGYTLRRLGGIVRVNIEKLDRVLNIISELGALSAEVSRVAARFKDPRRATACGAELSKIDRNLEKRLSELRGAVLDVRMVPIGTLFNRFDTVLNRLSREMGKEVSMETRGDETELDKVIIEELADPLMHIIRNMVDHGIEPPRTRVALGKPVCGTVTLSAYQKDTHVVVEVKDDGAGIGVESIKARAVEKGILTAKEAAGLTRKEALDLIFLPGFSTKETVTETSGRGVGMDVVRENVSRLCGSIDIETVEGKGTRFILTIPATLAMAAPPRCTRP